MTVWKVVGEACTDSSGGPEEWLYVTASDTELPECTGEIPAPGHVPHSWSVIDRIERLGCIAGAIEPDSAAGQALLALLRAQKAAAGDR